MARLNNAQTSPQVARARTARTTRSQSRDAPSEPPTQRRSHRGRRQPSEESDGRTEIRPGRRTRGLAKSAATELPTVRESMRSHIDLGEEAEDAGNEIIVNESITVDRVPSPGLSTMSGTTALTSHSAQELADLDADTILDALPDLSETASKLLDVLSPLGATLDEHEAITRELQIPASKTAKRLNRLEPLFQSQREYFGSDHYIDWSIIMRVLLGRVPDRENEIGPWRPDGILQKANLTSMVARLLPKHRDSPDTYPTLQLLDSVFPLPFVSSFEDSPEAVAAKPGSSQFLERTFELGMEIRTQFLISMLKSYAIQPNFDPDKVLLFVFFDTSSKGHKVKGWDTEELGGGNAALPERFSSAITTHCERIRAYFYDETADTNQRELVDFELLEKDFPWAFLTEAIGSWSRARLEEIETQFVAQGGVAGIVYALNEMVQTNDNRSIVPRPGDPPLRTMSSAQLPASIPHKRARVDEIRRPSGKSFNSPSNIARLKQREQRGRTSNVGPAVVPESSAPIVTVEDEDMEGLTGPPRPSQSALDVVARFQQSQTEKAKENRDPLQPEQNVTGLEKPRSFIDRQPDATRVTPERGFDASQASQQDSVHKRRRNEEEDDDGSEDHENDDDGFEEDTRAVDAARRRAAPVAPRRQVPAPDPSPIQAVEISDEERETPSHQPPRPTQSTPSQRPPVHPPLSSFSPSERLDYGTQYSQVQQVAKQRAARNAPRKVQSRTPWTDEATERLIYLIGDPDFGTRWSEIEKLGDPLLAGRGQVALKDKARNIKFDFLRALPSEKPENILPPGFDAVALKSAQWDQLDALRRQG